MERKGNLFLLKFIWNSFRHGIRANLIFKKQLLMKQFDVPPLPAVPYSFLSWSYRTRAVRSAGLLKIQC